jgi:hypothetical protein
MTSIADITVAAKNKIKFDIYKKKFPNPISKKIEITHSEKQEQKDKALKVLITTTNFLNKRQNAMV